MLTAQNWPEPGEARAEGDLMHAAQLSGSPKPEAPNATSLQFFGSRLSNKEEGERQGGKARGPEHTASGHTPAVGLATG